MKFGKENRNTLLALLAIGLFIVFDVVGLSLNYLLSWRIEQQAIGINLAGRQRMLSQRMVKVLLQIDSARRGGEATGAYFDELKLTFDLFDNTLRGFDAGHQTRGGSGEQLFLPAVSEPKARQAVNDAVALWQDYRARVIDLLAAGEKSDAALLQSVLAEAKARNLKLLGLMNALTTELEAQTQQEAQRIRIYQAIALILALLCFVWAFVLFRRRDQEIIQARQSATESARADNDYVSTQVACATASLQTAENLATLAHQLFATLAPPLGIGCASLFRHEDGVLTACGHYAASGTPFVRAQFEVGEGLVGECARERRMMVIADPPESHFKAQTALMSATPRALVLLPVVGNNALLGVIEMALLQALDARNTEVLDRMLPMLALRMEIIARTERAEKLLQAMQLQLGQTQTLQGEKS
jgi:hypothetical protein